ncbi:pseudouridine-5'-phosphate glycosidase [Plakobranchus ocellatus]|uniref:Pseudouridine-5'-phosphate glycosidase n=1 Tax=Plakobranchus ocellatus TaxID=259542 RepID=A0AAV3YVJ0_9GAST|nr:pseudouridine-5'-phosphate glycosidase [Plakobranchus ocellatus]
MRTELARQMHSVLMQRRLPVSPSCCKAVRRYLMTSLSRTQFASDYLCISEEVKDALMSRKAIVALESTIITHGMPYPHNFSTALCVERKVRENGAIPATVAAINGKICVGMNDTDIIWLAEKNNKLAKISRRDLASVLGQGGSGGMTVSATMIAARMAGIPIFATGGIGGVHRGAESSFDVSADLTELGRTPVAVVSSGVKSILDIPKTLEYLETQGVFVASFSDSKEFPAFFTQSSGCEAPYNVTRYAEAAKIIDTQLNLGLESGMLFAVPIPKELSLAGETIEAAIKDALSLARKKNITGKEITPFVLSTVNEITGGESLVANIALVENNASVASGIANCLAQLRNGVLMEDVEPPMHSSSFSVLQPAPSPALASAISSATGSSASQPPLASMSSVYGSKSNEDNDRQSFTEVKKLHGRPVVIGATVVDLTVRVNDPNFKMNGATYSGKVTQSMGGVGRNLADCLSRLGCNPVFVSAVGKNFRPDGCSHMDLGLVQHLDHSSATYCPVLRQDGHLLFGVGDMDINSAFDVDKVPDVDEAIQSAPVVMIDGNFSENVIHSVVKKCATYSTPVWFEPTDLRKCQKPFLTDAWRGLTVVSPNTNELLSMHECIMKSLGRSENKNLAIDELDNFQDLLSKCVRMCRDLVPHIPVVLVTLGCHGLLVCHNQGPNLSNLLPSSTTLPIQRVPQFQAVYYPTLGDNNDIKSVSGAGDCLAATLVAATLAGHSLDQSIKLALLAANLSLASTDAVPESVSYQSVLHPGLLNKFPHWERQVLE